MADDATARWAAGEAAKLLAAARADALEQARRQLTAELTDALLSAARAGAEPSPQPAPSGAPSGDGLWLYGVIDGGVAAAPSLVGVDGGHRVELVRAAGLAALASAVPLDRFGADALREALEDMSVVETLARGHERVLDAALALGAVVPFRLCTIYESADHVREMLERESDGLAATLDRLRGME